MSAKTVSSFKGVVLVASLAVLFGGAINASALEAADTKATSPILYGWFSQLSSDSSGFKSLLSVPPAVNIISDFGLNGLPSDEKSADEWAAMATPLGQVHARGQKVVFDFWLTRAFGGHTTDSGGSYTDDAAGYAAFAKDMYDQIVKDNLDGIDADIEFGIIYGEAKNEALMNALAKYFGPKANTGLLFIYNTNQAGSDKLFTQTHDNYDYVVEQAYWRNASSLDGTWKTYSPYINKSQFIVTVDFEDGTGWSSSYGTSGCPEIYDYAAWVKKNGTGGVGAYLINEDYNNDPSYKFTLGASQILQGAPESSVCSG